ncbi:C-reactive protein-like [Hyla sarda]|uniref:C-reactive protein-like n=1 Tax=Hyla sarda TaxID=327740 RepID=UPI0024C2A05E|nr:C-reactive protein-like [Hyla sarda]XP_056403211.1 C-reactive protein-like [Hyla sarda]
MKILALLFVVITGYCAKENLHGASFVFSKISQTSRVVLNLTEVPEPLSNITVCLQSYTDNVQEDSLFKLVDTNSKAQFHLFQVRNYYNIFIDQTQVYYVTSPESMEWRLICVSWESGTGLIHFVVNGKLFPMRVLAPGFIIDQEVTAVLGHHLSSTGIYLSNSFSYIGEIRNVHMWDRAFHPSEMQSLYFTNCNQCNGSVINWNSVDYEVHGDIFLYKPSVKP